MLGWTAHHKIDLQPWSALEEFQARVGARPTVQTALEAEGLGR
jgi:glutathione S-transferase